MTQFWPMKTKGMLLWGFSENLLSQQQETDVSDTDLPFSPFYLFLSPFWPQVKL